jgi:hypothetical protein
MQPSVGLGLMLAADCGIDLIEVQSVMIDNDRSAFMPTEGSIDEM